MQHQAEEKGASCFGKGFVASCSLIGQRPVRSCGDPSTALSGSDAPEEQLSLSEILKKQDFVKMEELLIEAGKSAMLGTVRRLADTAGACATGYAVEDVDGPTLSACFEAVMPCLELLDRMSDLGARFALLRAVSARKD